MSEFHRNNGRIFCLGISFTHQCSKQTNLPSRKTHLLFSLTHLFSSQTNLFSRQTQFAGDVGARVAHSDDDDSPCLDVASGAVAHRVALNALERITAWVVRREWPAVQARTHEHAIKQVR